MTVPHINNDGVFIAGDAVYIEFAECNEEEKLLADYENAKAQLTYWKAEEVRLRIDVANLVQPANIDGTFKVTKAGYTTKVVKKLNYTLDKDHKKVYDIQEKMEVTGNEGYEIAQRLFKWEVDISVREYKTLDKPYKDLVDTVLTITDAAPTVEVKKNATQEKA